MEATRVEKTFFLLHAPTVQHVGWNITSWKEGWKSCGNYSVLKCMSWRNDWWWEAKCIMCFGSFHSKKHGETTLNDNSSGLFRQFCSIAWASRLSFCLNFSDRKYSLNFSQMYSWHHLRRAAERGLIKRAQHTAKMVQRRFGETWE